MVLPVWVLVSVALVAIAALKIVHFFWSLYYVTKCLEPIQSSASIHWLYGNLHHRRGNPNYFLERAIWGSKHGVKISKEWLGPFIATIVIHHPDVWKKMLNKPKAAAINGMVKPWLGDGLLLSAGQKWSRNRKLLTAAFHFETLKPYVQIYNECSDVLVKKWTECIVNGQSIPVYSDLSRMTLDTLLKCSFSHDSNCQLEDIQYTRAVQQLAILFQERSTSVPLRVLPNFIYMNLTPHGRRFKAAYTYVHTFAEKVIAKRKKALANIEADSTVDSKNIMAQALQKGNRKCLDFIDILLMARDEDGHGLTDIEIRYEVDTFMFEGHDTTAHGLAWTLYCLAENPEHQQKCREEINEVFGYKDHLEYDDLSKLTYTQWCIKESMRMYPTVFGFLRQLEEDTMIDGHKIPKGTLVNVSVMNIHHNKEFWPDPEVFDPLRFHPDRISKQHPYAYTPFSAGPRNCIGQNFAMNEMRVVIAGIIRKFKVSLIEGKRVQVFAALLYGFKHDLPLKFELI